MQITFEPVTADHFPLLRRWIAAPHVAAWWGEVEEEMALIAGHLASDEVRMFVFALTGEKAGFIQAYRAADWPGHGFDQEAPGTMGIDLFIGEAALLGRGIGVAVIEAFCAHLFDEGAPAIVIDPDPANARAVRAYEKAGFVTFGRFDDPEHGAMLLMRKQRPG